MKNKQTKEFLLVLLAIGIATTLYFFVTSNPFGYFTASSTSTSSQLNNANAPTIDANIIQISGKNTIRASASDPTSVSKIIIYLDGKQVKVCTFTNQISATCDFDLTSASLGVHTYKATATDGTYTTATLNKQTTV